MTTTDFNLRDVIRDVLDTTDLADPGDIADEAFRRLTDGDYAVALRQTLRGYVRVMLSAQRRSQPSSVARTVQVPQSWKVNAWRQWRAERERDRVETSNGWRLLRDCTRDDLLYAAETRRRKAAENIAVAERFEKLATHLVGGATVADLPDDVFGETLGRVAA